MGLKTLAILAGVLALSACQTGGDSGGVMLFKPNNKASEKQADLDQCKIESFRSIPQVMGTQSTAGWQGPASVQCHRNGNATTCDEIPGLSVPARQYSVDVNAGLRFRYVEQCMRRKGYATIHGLPMCSSEKARQATRSARRAQDVKCIATRLDY